MEPKENIEDTKIRLELLLNLCRNTEKKLIGVSEQYESMAVYMKEYADDCRKELESIRTARVSIEMVIMSL